MTAMNRTDRLSTLGSYRILDTEPDALFDALTKLAANAFDAPASALCFVDKKRQWFKSEYGWNIRETGLDESICRHAIESDDLLVIEDAGQDARCRDNPLVRSPDGIGFYAGAPLIAPNGHRLGTLFVVDRAPRQPDERMLQTLRHLAKLAMGLLEAHKTGIEFTEERDCLLRLADNSAGGLFEFAMDGAGNKRFNFASTGIAETIGVTPKEASDNLTNILARVHPNDLEALVASVDAAFRNRSRWKHEFRVNHPTRGTLWLLGISEPVNALGGVMTWQGFLIDVTDRVAEQIRLRETQAELEGWYKELADQQVLFQQLERMAKIGACSTDLKTGAVKWTPEIYTIHELKPDALPRSGALVALCEESHKRKIQRQFNEARRTGGAVEVEYPIMTARGNRRWLRVISRTDHDEDGSPVRRLATMQDVTGERKLLERARYNATHDHLTGLANRPTFFRHLCSLVARSRPSDCHALLFMDLDHFKDINDSFGYDAGDELIKAMGHKLGKKIEAFGGKSGVGRFGGDEFGILLADVGDPLTLMPQLQALLDELSSETSSARQTARITASVGVSLYPRDGTDAASLFRKADLALRHAKKTGRARFTCFTSVMEEEATADQLLKSDILRGLEAHEFEVYYQPLVNLRTAQLNGFEGLLRWNHPERGLQSAGLFAHLLDDPVVAARMSELVLDQVAETIRQWCAKGLAFGQIAINITSSELRNPLFEERLALLVRSGIDPAHVKLEITEGVLLGRTADKAVQVLKRVREMGFSIALDDFGTGYASLVHLTEFPIDQLKIDMSFVRKIAISEKDRTIVQTMCALAHGLSLTAVAEGIEDAEAEMMLRLMGCHYGQGYHYAKALPRIEAEAFIDRVEKLEPATAHVGE